MNPQRPVLLCIAGFDPTGGAGLQADAETAAALGVRAVCAQSCNTIQDSAGTQTVMAMTPEILARQIEYLANDFEIAAVKTGLIASAENANVVAEAVTELRRPLVADPVLRDGTGKTLCDENTARMIRGKLLPLARCATPNRAELAALVPEAAAPAEAARILLAEGCQATLVTSETSEERNLEHALYLSDGTRKIFSTPRLSGEFHGSGCTLSSALAAQLALGKPLHEAISLALAFTARALENADTPGAFTENGTTRKFPKRL